MGFDRRREKSFGEPTRVRSDGTTGTTRDDELPKRPANTAYERYKQELHAFFNGEKPLPEHLKDMLATRPGAAEHGSADKASSDAASSDDAAADNDAAPSSPSALSAKCVDVIPRAANKSSTLPTPAVGTPAAVSASSNVSPGGWREKSRRPAVRRYAPGAPTNGRAITRETS